MNTVKPWIISLIIFIILPLESLAEGGRDVTVRVRSYSNVPGSDVCLKDIADIHGSDSVYEQIKNLMITLAPRPGKKRRFPGSMVEAKLRGEFPIAHKKWTISIPDMVMIERDCQEISESDMKKLFYAFIEKKAGERSFRIRDFAIKGNRQIALGSQSFTVDDRNLRSIEGRVTLTVHARVPLEKSQKLFLSGWVDVYDQVVCASRDILRGELIQPSDLRLEKKNLSKIPGGIFHETIEASGSIARSHIGKGRCLRNSMIEKAPLVRKGDRVKIIAKSARMTISTSGVSMEDGALGEQILVENSKSSKKMTARIMDAETVEVLF
ncbi:MAG: flagellar basal body P-ring formation chaperone FlgA [Proteobacteria bacterium]|nr:flagellar basal body P-ring formation chaperone FlgA [Pseudomonadota bacterium]